METRKWRTLGGGDVRPAGYQRRRRWNPGDAHTQWGDGDANLVGRAIGADDASDFEFRAPVADEAPAPPEGYEIVDREADADAVIQEGWFTLICGEWSPTTSAGTTLRQQTQAKRPYARPIRKPDPAPESIDTGSIINEAASVLGIEPDPAPRSFWVPASVRQPPAGMEVPTWRDDRAFGWKYRPNNHPCHDLPGDVTWLDLDAAEAIATERDRLAAENERLRARVAELEQSRNEVTLRIVVDGGKVGVHRMQ